MRDMTRIPIDWQQIALNIQAAGKPLSHASIELGCCADYLGRIARGIAVEPFFTQGLKLLDYHLDLCGFEKHQAVMVYNRMAAPLSTQARSATHGN